MRKVLLPLFVTLALLSLSCSGKRETPESQSAAQPVVDPSLPLIGYVDVPAEGATVRGNFGIGGWALWGQGVQEVQILLDGFLLANAQINIPRPDVLKVHPPYQNPNSGWGMGFNAASLKAGKRQVSIRVKSKSGTVEELKSFSVIVAKP